MPCAGDLTSGGAIAAVDQTPGASGSGTSLHRVDWPRSNEDGFHGVRQSDLVYPRDREGQKEPEHNTEWDGKEHEHCVFRR